MRITKLNTFFSLVFVFCSHSAVAFKAEDRVGIGTQNSVVFQHMEFRLDGSSLIRNVEIYPMCGRSRIKLVDREAEIFFYAGQKICSSVMNYVGSSFCGIVTGDVEVSPISRGLVERYEVTHLENLKDGCPIKPRPDKEH